MMKVELRLLSLQYIYLPDKSALLSLAANVRNNDNEFMPEVLPYESLHNHTVISDGQLTHLEVLDAAQAAGFGLISFTDHDILPRQQDLEALQTYTGPVNWNVGIEITSGLPIELGGGAASLFHILGLDIDRTDEALVEYCGLAKDARLERLERTVRNLQGIGFNISLDECTALAGEGSVGTPHITRAVIKDADNMRRMEAIAEDMRSKARTNPELQDKYDEMMLKVRNGHRHPYIRDLFLSDDPYIPDVYVPYLYYLDMDKSVELIRNAGGVAVMAHYPTVREEITAEHLEQIAASRRIDGLELRSVYDSGPVSEDIRFLSDMASRHDLLQTVGVDSHDPDDFQKFVEIDGAVDLTIGQWARLRANKK